MRPFRHAPALLSALLLQTSLSSIARAQPAPPPDTQEGADAEEAPMDDAEEAPPSAPADGGKPPAPPAEQEPPADEEIPSDAEMEAEADKELAAEEAAGAAILSKPPAKGMGAVVGVVTDTKFNESIIEAPVTVLGTKRKTFTDIEGRFRLELPPGTYNIRFVYELHQPSRVDQIVVKAGEITRTDVSLVPDESAVETVEIVSDVDKTSLEGQTLERRRSAAVGDGVGRVEIARTPDRNAAEAARRVVGASIVGGRFVYVRGLGERYTNAALNGSPLPSPEPDRNTVPLDLFPALIVDSLTINKTFTPDQAADFAGGSVRIFTRQFPRETLAQLSLNTSFNSASTFRQGLTYTGSGTDWLGYDNGVRQLPDGVPDYQVGKNLLKPDGTKITAEEESAIMRLINSKMSTRRKTMPPNFGGSLVLGDAWKVGPEQKLGAILALNYGRSYQISRDEIIRVYGLPGEGDTALRPLVDYKVERGVDSVRWGAFSSVSFEFSRNHRLSLNGLYSRSADDSAVELEGESSGTNTGRFHATRLHYTSRALAFGQLRGEHDFPGLLNARLDWFGSLSRATRNEPDTRDNRYRFRDELMPQAWSWVAAAQSGSHFFADQAETQRGGGLDWTQPFAKSEQAAKLKIGGQVSERNREFDARRFEFARGTSLTPAQNALFACEGVTYSLDCPDKLFRSSNIGGALTGTEKTRENDAYDAALNVYAGYAMLDVEVIKSLRTVGGARIEKTQQSIDSFDPFAIDEVPVSGKINETDVLPALSMMYAATSKANARLAVTRTLARPQLRELAPFQLNPYFGGLPTRGNPDLSLTYITNADLRFEYFPTLREVLAFSIFHKHFKDPIEEVLLTQGESYYVTYQNATGADLIGVELEARKGLSSFAPALREFSVLANLTLVKSKVKLATVGTNTNSSRPLSNQSPYIVNLALDYSHEASRTQARLLYNVSGARIVTVGADGLQDIYEEPRHLLDLTVVQGLGKHLELKATVQNILDAKTKLTQAGIDPDGDGSKGRQKFVTGQSRQGTTFVLSASYTY
jgi:TonB-dependent receptor